MAANDIVSPASTDIPVPGTSKSDTNASSVNNLALLVSSNQEEEEKKCCICDKIFLSVKDLKEHEKTEEHKRKMEVERKKHLNEISPALTDAALPGTSNSDANTTPKKEEIECTICDEIFTRDQDFKIHEKTEKHKRKIQLEMEKTKNLEKFWKRSGTTDTAEQYLHTLAVFFVLRYCIVDLEYSDVRVSVDNEKWLTFGDMVVEVVDKKYKTVKIFCFQIKQTQKSKQIQLSSVTAEDGKFSLRTQYQFITSIRKKNDFSHLQAHLNDHSYLKAHLNDHPDLKAHLNDHAYLKVYLKDHAYLKAHFVLLTTSDLKADDLTTFVYDDVVLARWKDETEKEIWEGREGIILMQKTDHLVDTTDDVNNMCKLKILKHKEDQKEKNEDLDSALGKFTLLINQKKLQKLREMIANILDRKFGLNFDITTRLIDSIRDHFDREGKYNYNLTKKHVLLKMCELVFGNFYLFPGHLYEPKDLKHWNKIIDTFDIIVIKNKKDIIKQLYACLNHILPKIGCSPFTIKKEELNHETFKFEIFRGFENHSSRDITEQILYTSLWKTGLAPLVLRPEDVDDLNTIFRLAMSMRLHNFPLSLIVVTDFPINRSTLPTKVKTMTNLQDLKNEDPKLYEEVTQELEIPVLNKKVSLKELIAHNSHFLYEITPSSLLNMNFGRFSYSAFFPPPDERLEEFEEFVDKTLVVSHDVLTEIESHLKKIPKAPKENREYVVNIKGNPRIIQVPADLTNFSV